MRGLSSAEAAARFAAEGPNALPTAGRYGTLAIALGVLREPMFLLLIAASAVYLVLGDTAEALVLAASIVVIVAITVVQERRTERALEALRDLSSPRARVIRDGQAQTLAGRELVRGDLILLAEGDRIAADAELLSAGELQVDESLLTGESLPVSKSADGVSALHAGTLVVQGQGLARVSATGPRSQMGQIGRALQTVRSEESPLRRQTQA